MRRSHLDGSRLVVIVVPSQTTLRRAHFFSGDDTHRAWLALALAPVAAVVGFVIGSILIGDPNASDAPHGLDAAWRTVVVWIVVAAAPAVGAVWGARAVRARHLDARIPLALNLGVFALLTVITLFGELINPS